MVDIVLEYILQVRFFPTAEGLRHLNDVQNCNAQVAIACHDDIDSLLLVGITYPRAACF